MATAAPAKQKVAILGGGVGAMTTAFALTDQPGWSDRYEITVYQMGWRLGGKGASGRDRGNGDRILEHGLHIWFGFYHNAFRMMQVAYKECTQLGLAPGSPFASWTDAFKGQNLLTAMESVDAEWKRWDIHYLIRPGQPGEGEATLGPWDYVKLILGWMKQQIQNEGHPISRLLHIVGDSIHILEEEVRTVIAGVGVWFKSTKVEIEPAFPATAPDLRAAHTLAESMHDDPHQQTFEHRTALLGLLQSFHTRLHAHVAKAPDSDRYRREWELFDLATSMVRGLVADDVIGKGFDVIDRYDAREWLAKHGCRSYNSSMVRGTYDLVFAYDRGDLQKPNFAAGTAMRAILRILFDYKGSITYKMQAGMGDTIFSPLYLLLKHRGVKFAFFHKVTNLGLAADKTAVDSIAIDVQARLKPKVFEAQGGYDPLVAVKGLPCWPSTPLYDQIEDGEALEARLAAEHTDLESGWCRHAVEKKQLRRGEDFDLVVLGISLGGIKFVAPEVLAANPAWRDLVAHVPTVETQAFQLWLTRDAAGLGWEAKERAVVGAFVEPIDTWADMTQVLDKEAWPEDVAVRNVSYFCAALACPEEPPLDDPAYPARQEQVVKDNALDFLRNDVRPLWPLATDPANPSGLDWSLLVAPAGATGAARFDSQFWRANTDPSERYVLSLKGTTQYRFKSDETGFVNLYLAGDWTYNDINLGCVEAAAMSGLFASRGISGEPRVIFGEDKIRTDLHAHP